MAVPIKSHLEELSTGANVQCEDDAGKTPLEVANDSKVISSLSICLRTFLRFNAATFTRHYLIPLLHLVFDCVSLFIDDHSL
jgi:hypothetical protein